MKKLKIFFIILIALIFTLVIAVYMMYKSDMKRMANKEPVKYSNWGYAYTTIIGNSQTNSKKIEKNYVENLEIDINNYNKKDIKLKNIVWVILFIVVTVSFIIAKFRKK